MEAKNAELLALQRIDETSVRLQKQGKYLEALECMERGLVLRQHFFGANSEEVWGACKTVGEMCNLLAMTYLQQEDFPMVLELLKKAEILTERDEQGKAVTFNNLACYYRRQGKLHAALTYLQKAVRIEHQLRDVENKADTHLNLCAVLSQLGRHAGALEHAQTALIMLQEELFSNPMVGSSGETVAKADRVAVLAIAYHNIGVEQEFLRKYEMSIQSYAKGVNIGAKHLGDNHGITVTLRNSLLAAKRSLAKKLNQNAQLPTRVPRKPRSMKKKEKYSPTARDEQRWQTIKAAYGDIPGIPDIRAAPVESVGVYQVVDIAGPESISDEFPEPRPGTMAKVAAEIEASPRASSREQTTTAESQDHLKPTDSEKGVNDTVRDANSDDSGEISTSGSNSKTANTADSSLEMQQSKGEEGKTSEKGPSPGVGEAATESSSKETSVEPTNPSVKRLSLDITPQQQDMITPRITSDTAEASEEKEGEPKSRERIVSNDQNLEGKEAENKSEETETEKNSKTLLEEQKPSDVKEDRSNNEAKEAVDIEGKQVNDPKEQSVDEVISTNKESKMQSSEEQDASLLVFQESVASPVKESKLEDLPKEDVRRVENEEGDEEAPEEKSETEAKQGGEAGDSVEAGGSKHDKEEKLEVESKQQGEGSGTDSQTAQQEEQKNSENLSAGTPKGSQKESESPPTGSQKEPKSTPRSPQKDAEDATTCATKEDNKEEEAPEKESKQSDQEEEHHSESPGEQNEIQSNDESKVEVNEVPESKSQEVEKNSVEEKQSSAEEKIDLLPEEQLPSIKNETPDETGTESAPLEASNIDEQVSETELRDKGATAVKQDAADNKEVVEDAEEKPVSSKELPTKLESKDIIQEGVKEDSQNEEKSISQTA